MRLDSGWSGEPPTPRDRDVCLGGHDLDLPAVPQRRARVTQHATQSMRSHEVDVELGHAVPAAREPGDVTRANGSVERRTAGRGHELRARGEPTLLSDEPDDVGHPGTLTPRRLPVERRSTGHARTFI